MDRSTPARGAIAPDLDQSPRRQGLLPGLLATIRDYRRVPPERALFRELVFTAVGRTIASYTVGGFRISASTIKVVAWGLFARMDTAGVIVDDQGRPFSRDTLAKDASISTRVLRAALIFLRQAGLITIDPAHGRQRAIIRVNLGGLDWGAIRRRVKIAVDARDGTDDDDEPVNRQGPLPLYRKGDETSPLRSRRGDETSPLGGYVRGEKISEPIAAADPSRASSADRWQEQQQRDQARLEGLLGAVAARARQLGHDFDEADERHRLAEGEIDVAALQALADDLEAELADRGDVRHHRITAGLDGRGRCAVCGQRPSSETELCPGRPRRGRIQALAEDRAAEEDRC